jgi:transaldolase
MSLGLSSFKNKIKIYSDGADKASMLEMNSNPLISGLTTNPSLMKKAGITDYRSFCLDILKSITTKPVSFEVFSDDFAEMKKQAMEIKSWGENVYVKIPIMNSKGESSIPLVKELAHAGVKLNVTAIFTMDQTLETCYAVKGGAPSIVSIFAGRIADSGRDPRPLMKGASLICETLDKNIELLWASTREVYNIVEAEESGCHIITVPPDIIKKMSGFNRDLTQLSLDTVKTFKADSEAAGFKL